MFEVSQNDRNKFSRLIQLSRLDDPHQHQRRRFIHRNIESSPVLIYLLVLTIFNEKRYLEQFDDLSVVDLLKNMPDKLLTALLSEAKINLGERPEVIKAIAECSGTKPGIASTIAIHYFKALDKQFWLEHPLLLVPLLESKTQAEALNQLLDESDAAIINQLGEIIQNISPDVSLYKSRKSTIDALLFPYLIWTLMPGDSGTEEQRCTAALIALPLMILGIVISLLAVVLAIPAAIIHHALAKPIRTRIDQQLAFEPTLEPIALVKNYQHIRQRFFSRVQVEGTGTVEKSLKVH